MHIILSLQYRLESLIDKLHYSCPSDQVGHVESSLHIWDTHNIKLLDLFSSSQRAGIKLMDMSVGNFILYRANIFFFPVGWLIMQDPTSIARHIYLLV